MRLKVSYEIMLVEGQYFAVPMEKSEDGFGGMVKLTKTAAVIFELLQQETTEETIVDNMSQQFDVSKGVLAADVHRVITMLQAKELLL